MPIILRNTKQIFGLFLKIRGGINEGDESDCIAYTLASELAAAGVCDAHLEWPDLVPEVIEAYKYIKEHLDRYYEDKEDRNLYAANFVVDAIRAWVKEDNSKSWKG